MPVTPKIPTPWRRAIVTRSAGSITSASIVWSTVPAVAASLAPMLHGGVTGLQDVAQDYGVLLFLVAIVLIGAGVLAWVMLTPQADEDESPEEADSPAP